MLRHRPSRLTTRCCCRRCTIGGWIVRDATDHAISGRIVNEAIAISILTAAIGIQDILEMGSDCAPSDRVHPRNR
jgi:hypothetical protein